MNKEKLKIEYIDIKKLRENEYNPKQMTEKEAIDLEKSITEFGVVDPLIANKAKGREGLKRCYYCNKKFINKKINLESKRHFCNRRCWSHCCAENLGSWTNPQKIAKRNKELWFRERVRQGLKKHFKKNPRNQEQWYIDRYGENYIPSKLKHCNSWKRTSKLLRNKYSCHRCNENKLRLDVHHIIPFAISKDNSIFNLMVLCRSCHKFVEDNNLKIFNIVKNWEIVRYLVRLSFEDNGTPLNYKI